ncbi:GNAT family N-acetyltransferase [Asanoa sp. WMMD1127]|uniref:GNAT family N-acetyltransferase n=1 Tax=Asanoa sp. WMMD1127 TaxID=3016107 RepID=UPI0024173206|nr:GNAT family N-acetyltransferase [Asanoa sp. WMMD1127]MDG4827375.1 GNAT family N-acetyltransferase [Asanoa sp. WMMD1127]
MDELIAEAQQVATAAAARLGITVRELRDPAAHEQVAQLFGRIWRTDSPNQLLDARMMRALSYAGNYVVGAFREGVLVGAAVAFFGIDHLHSHITGVDPDTQSRGAGHAIKLHQRAWALDRRIESVHWTFDPLVRRNAYFNLHKLGARAVKYLPDFYGRMTDGINAGDATSDRLYIQWDVASPEAIAAAAGDTREINMQAVYAAGAEVALARDDFGRPSPGKAVHDGRPLLVAVPLDIEAMRGTDPPLAVAWRREVGDALCAAFDSGYRIAGMARDGWYVMEAE